MKKQDKKRMVLTAVISLISGLVLGAGGMFLAGRHPGTDSGSQDLQELYLSAVKDAVFAEPEEIRPLVSLTKEDPLVTWDEAGERVLLCTWHNYPESYPAGEKVTLEWGTVWTFTPDELEQKYNAEFEQVSDWELRLKQLIGFAPDSEHTTFTTFWVNPEDICRPACQPDPCSDKMQPRLDLELAEESYISWFNENILDSYFYGAYPWTRLGYTYDWADNGSPYGLSEFLIRQGAEVQVVDTKTTKEFLEQIKND